MISHPDAEIQSIITSLEEQRDGAIVGRGKFARALAAANAEIERLNGEVARLNEALAAAAKFQGASNVIDLQAERVEEPAGAAA